MGLCKGGGGEGIHTSYLLTRPEPTNSSQHGSYPYTFRPVCSILPGPPYRIRGHCGSLPLAEAREERASRVWLPGPN